TKYLLLNLHSTFTIKAFFWLQAIHSILFYSILFIYLFYTHTNYYFLSGIFKLNSLAWLNISATTYLVFKSKNKNILLSRFHIPASNSQRQTEEEEEEEEEKVSSYTKT